MAAPNFSASKTVTELEAVAEAKAVTGSNAPPPFTNDELQRYCDHKSFCYDEKSAEFVRDWLEANKGRWHTIHHWNLALNGYMEKRRYRAKWEAPDRIYAEYDRVLIVKP
jgi:hypothetical protein